MSEYVYLFLHVQFLIYSLYINFYVPFLTLQHVLLWYEWFTIIYQSLDVPTHTIVYVNEY